MSFQIIPARPGHIDWLIDRDRHVSDDWVRRCVSLGEYLVAEREGEPVGFLRFSWFWGTIPYLEMIQVLAAHRRAGVGGTLLEAWQETMHGKGATLLLTSCVEEESEPRAWHRRNGFVEAGRMALGHLQTESELFLVKDLRPRETVPPPR
jgi:GNAT superfamily N-acetyltransferase